MPRVEGGYCTDDVARALVAVCHEPGRPPELERLAALCLSFLERAQLPDGRFHNRLSAEGRWLDEVGSDDSIGRALLGLATAATAATTADARRRSLRAFDRGAGFCTPSPRANALAVLAAAAVLTVMPDHLIARTMLETAARGLGRMCGCAAWPWPEDRLAYANALLPEGCIAAGLALGEPQLLEDGLAILDWLLGVESSAEGYLSFTPVGGWALGEPRPGFDQQPIEAGAMADACARAYGATGERRWAAGALRAAAWFLGENDVGMALFDPVTGGCRDGLERDGCNENQGAESTLALITAFQRAREVQAAERSARTSLEPSTVAAPTHRSAAP